MNEILAEMIILENRNQASFQFEIKSRDGDWYGIKFKVGTKETLLERYRNILDQLDTKPTPEECKEYFDEMGVPVEILPSIMNKVEDLDE